ncbi:acetoacetate--CoA ligase, partial [Mesorhizobium sp. M2C.T.Ca.TU.009.01.2.1]
MATDTPLWTPTQERIDAAPLTAFMKAAEAKAAISFSGYAELHRWSIDNREAFWSLVWDFCGLVGDKGERGLVDGERMPGASFFPDARLNFAENLLQRTGGGPAIVFRGEDKVERRLSWNELHALTSRLQQLLLSLGVKAG